MGAESAAPAFRGSGGNSLWRRLDHWLDPVIGIVAAALALTSLLTTDVAEIDPRLHEPDLLAAVATVVAAGALAWRRTRPRASYAVFLVGAMVVSGTFHYIGLLSILMLLSLYSLTTHGRRRDAAIGLVAGLSCFVVLGLAGVPDLRTKDVLLALALLVAAWAAGEAVRSRREQQQATLHAVVTEERLRIARELHDVVAHSMSLIAVQAGVGAHVIRTDPDAAEQALETIAETSRRALDQTRSMLGMLREEPREGTRPPGQGVDDLPALAHDLLAAGLEVDLVRSGATPRLDAAVSLTAYRIVQESLTNVVKHSAATTATVEVTASATALDIEVTDPGPPRTAGRKARGHGLVGLEERVRLVGGTVAYGGHGRGFRVHATLPLESRR
ncbi:sensor histidine kinase [Nocardioides sp. P5_C9_2]